MNPLKLYEAYSAVYDEELRSEILNVEEDFAFIDELSDMELDNVMEEILSEGVELSECVEAFDEVLSEARVDMSARAKARREYQAASEKSAKEARGRAAAKEKSERRAERVERIKSSAKRAAEKVKTTAAGVASAAAGGAAEAGRKAKAGVKKVGGKLAAAKEKLKGFIKSGRKAVAGGLRGLAAKVEPKEEPKADREPKTYRGAGAGRKETVGKQVKTAAKEKIKTTTYRGQGVGRKEAASSGGVSSRSGSMGSEGPKGKALPPVGKTKSGKTLTQQQRGMQTAAQNARLERRLGEDFDTLAEMILEDLINEGYAETFEEAFTVLESFSDYEVGEIAEGYLTEEVETVDLYDVVLEHLLDEGFADTEEAATVIMANMSEEWREEILDEAAVRNRGLVDGRNKLANDAIDAAGRTVPTHPKGLRMIPTRQSFRRLPDGNPKTKHANKAKKDAYYQDQRYGKGSSGVF
jgi:hypothetical protein